MQCCFAAAEALGLIDVSRALHRAAATPHLPGFLARPAEERWWVVLEAIWQRVSWLGLRPNQGTRADVLQAARWWLGRELARRSEPLVFDHRLAYEPEVLDMFLFPLWRDAGLVRLTIVDRATSEQTHRQLVRRARLGAVEVTEAGRFAFQELAMATPQAPKANRFRDPRDGRWNGEEFLHRLREAEAASLRLGHEGDE